MALHDAALLTFINTAACLAFPKLLSIVLTAKGKVTKSSSNNSTAKTATVKITSFPYCTVYSLTGSEFCKFSPDFCGKCSPS
jgi:hypothetical protein